MKAKIKRNDQYVLKNISGTNYLIPFGQMIADFRKGVALNETGKWLFNLLEEPLSRKEILDRAAQYYEIPKEHQKELKNDINSFLDKLISTGILIEEGGIPKDVAGGREGFSNMAGIKVRFSCEDKFFPEEFKKFEGNFEGKPDLNIAITSSPPAYSPPGEQIIRFEELTVLKGADRYILYFPKAKGVIEAHMSLRGNACLFYITGDTGKEALYDLFRSIRVPVLFNARTKGKIAVHSSSILYRDRVWLFSAPSGVGKSYHTFLWNSLYKTPVINGDTSVVGLDDNGISTVYGCPWCGTSNICHTKSYRLGGIILIKRSRRDFVEELSEAEKRLLVLQRLISPSWDDKALLKNLSLVEKLMDKILVCRLNCTMDKTAVMAIKAKIDKVFGK